YLIDVPDGVVVLDPGPADAPHLRAVAKATNGRAKAILLSHGHADHCAGASVLADMLGTPVLGHESFTSRVAAITGQLRHGDRIGELTCLHTPGHAIDHLCFALPGGIVFTGDHV
ncbi:MBL fold metallo-hydrolase, partial [Paracoccus sp. PXZ]